MIIEANEKTYYQTDEELKLFWNKKYNVKEQEEFDKLKALLINFQQKAFPQEKSIIPSGIVTYGYLENFGYYVIENSDRGHYTVCNYGLDLDIAFKSIIKDILFSWAIDYEFDNRANLKIDFYNRFSTFFDATYEPCFYFAEYCLEKWQIYYEGIVPTDIINYYENYLNSLEIKKNVIWRYDEKIQKLKCVKIIVRKLEKGEKL